MAELQQKEELLRPINSALWNDPVGPRTAHTVHAPHAVRLPSDPAHSARPTPCTSPQCTADPMHRVWHTGAMCLLAALTSPTDAPLAAQVDLGEYGGH